MCRLFGFRSIIPSKVHRSLVGVENALCNQSLRHPDGWGVAYYVDGAPHVVKSADSAFDDHLFHRVSGIVSSETVLAHIRKATVGGQTILNSHPFQHGRWVFAHNGDVPAFEGVRAPLLAEVAPRLARFILGETDSEVIFFLFLTKLAEHGALASTLPIDAVAGALAATVARVRTLCDGRPGVDRALLTLMVTNGETLVATRGGRPLFWSSYKSRCADRSSCPSFAPECEAMSRTGLVNHFVVSSEPLGGENVWIELPEGQVVGVDVGMRMINRPLVAPPLPVLA
jgi:predicted glutamine amidotransferase